MQEHAAAVECSAGQAFCLQPGHKDRKAFPEFAKRAGKEARLSKYIAVMALGCIPGFLIFGTIANAVGRTIGNESWGIIGLIAGSLVVPVALACSVVAERKEKRRREELYSSGQLLAGWVTACAVTDHYYAPSHPDAIAERSGAHVLAVSFCFDSPTGRRLCGSAQAIHDELPSLPPYGAAVTILYLDDDRYEIL